jgi:hypothetical protein
VDSTEVNGKLVVNDFNVGYAQKLRDELKDAIHGVMTDADVVKLWVDRYNYERESPRLEVVHGEVSPEGRVNVKLEWNDAFIKMLQDAGVEGESEDDIIRVYLASVTSKVDQEIADADDVDMTEPEAPAKGSMPARQPSDSDVDQILDQMEPDVLKMFEKNIRRRAAKRRK